MMNLEAGSTHSMCRICNTLQMLSAMPRFRFSAGQFHPGSRIELRSAAPHSGIEAAANTQVAALGHDIWAENPDHNPQCRPGVANSRTRIQLVFAEIICLHFCYHLPVEAGDGR